MVPGSRVASLILTVLLVATLTAADQDRTTILEPEAGLTVGRVLDLLRSGQSPATLLDRVRLQGETFDLSIEDVLRLVREGATPELIRAMAAAGGTPLPAGATSPAEIAGAGDPGTLRLRTVLRMHRRGVPLDEIARRVSREGFRETPDLGDLLDMIDGGDPPELIRIAARGREAAADPVAASAEPRISPPKPLGVTDVLAMLAEGWEPARIAGTILGGGFVGPLSAEEEAALREAGATAAILQAIRLATGEANRAVPRGPVATPTSESLDRLWIASVPSGTDVYVSPARTSRREALGHEYLVGETPLSLTLPPGEYNVVLRKEAGEFEEGLVPAWRTIHDAPDSRTILDDADLTFDPRVCCLPGSMSGSVKIHPVPRGQQRDLIGDQFDGLPPFLPDGERLQVIRVRRATITHALKLYRVRKNAGQSRILIGTFIPAEGDPLDPEALEGLPEGSPYDSLLASPDLEELKRPEGVAAVAGVLRVDEETLARALAFIGRAGKAIIPQAIEHGYRLISISVDDYGRLRVLDHEIRPVDPFPEPVPAGARKKKKKAVPPSEPAPLPTLARIVVPGLGLPRLVVENTTGDGIGLFLEDGQFCYTPPGATREFTMDPGTYETRAANAGGDARSGRLHFSYHARYTLTF